MNIKITISGLDKLIRNFSNAPRIIEEETFKAFDSSLKLIEKEVKLRTPVDFGRLRASIGTAKTKWGGTEGWQWIKRTVASIGTNVKYAFWVEVRPARHKVGEVGYFSKGVKASFDGIHRFFTQAIERVAQRLTK